MNKTFITVFLSLLFVSINIFPAEPVLTVATQRLYEFNADPTVTDDETLSYERGNWWLNTTTQDLFQCKDPTQGAAIWLLKPAQIISSFTPALTFGGDSTGITYTAQEGSMITIGNARYVSIFIALSSKGTSIGEVRIVGLPITNGSQNFSFTFYGHRLINTLLYGVFGARIAPAENEIRLFEQGTDLPLLALTNLTFNDNSQLFVSGFYFD